MMSIDTNDRCSYARHIGETGFEIRYLMFPLIGKGSSRELGHRVRVPTMTANSIQAFSVEMPIGSS